MPRSTCHHSTIRISTAQPTEFIDVTDRIDQILGQTGILFGIVNIQSLHTTTAVVVNEHEPLLLTDFTALLEKAASKHSVYRHDDPVIRTVNVTADERINGHSHCRALMLGSSACLNIVGGRLRLGQWQRVFLVELDGPRERDVSTMVLGERADESQIDPVLADGADEPLQAADQILAVAAARRRRGRETPMGGESAAAN